MRLFMIGFVVIALILVGAGFFILNWEIPAPITSIEKVIPDAKFKN
jgi:hypothetical protein